MKVRAIMQSVYERARVAVEEKLKINDFINLHWDAIEKRVLDAESRVADMKAGANVVFVAECLPFVAGIVHVGSELVNFRMAREWVRAELPNADAVSVLAALTFLYIVGIGLDRADPEKVTTWESIQHRVDTLLVPPKPPTAADGMNRTA